MPSDSDLAEVRRALQKQIDKLEERIEHLEQVIARLERELSSKMDGARY